MGRMDGRVAIVTGAGAGIGRASAVALAREGASVVCADINEAALGGVVSGIRTTGGNALAVTADVRFEDEVRAVVDAAVREYGQIDALVNNAGATAPEYLARDNDVVTTDLEFWRDVFSLNLESALFGCKYAIPHMLNRGRGTIVNMGSVAGIVAETALPAYGASKAALHHLTLTIATRYGRAGIRANAIAAGAVMSNAVSTTPASVLAMLAESHVTPYLGTPEQLGEVVLFLSCDDSAFVTGEVMRVDGGFLAHVPTYATRIRQLEAGSGALVEIAPNQ